MTGRIPLSEVSLNVVETTNDVEALFRWLGERRPVLACDTETTGLRYWRPDFRVRLVQFGDANTAYVLRADRFGAAISETLGSYSGRWAGHNFAAFDFHALIAAGLSFPRNDRVDDTLLMSKIAHSWEWDHSLKGLAGKRYGSEATFGQALLHEAFASWGLREDDRDPEISERAWTEIPYSASAYSVYSGMDVILTARLWEDMQADLTPFRAAYVEEMAAWCVTRNIEHKGLRVDLAWCEKLLDDFAQDIVRTKTQLAELGIDSPGSKVRIVDKLVRDGWIPQEFTEKDKTPKLDKAILAGIDNEAIAPLMEYRRLHHWRKAYVEAVIANSHNGRVYPGINPMGAKTGRQSARTPPIQQMPARHPDAWKLRRMFIPEEGNRFVSIDFQAQENRLTYHFSQDPALGKIFREGLDIHTYNAAAIFSALYANVTVEQRNFAKGYIYASNFGAGDAKLAKMLGINEGEIPVIRQRIDEAYPGVAKYKQRLEEEGRAQFQTKRRAHATTLAGRHVYFEQGRYGEPKYKDGLNYQTQGSGADMLKIVENTLASAELADNIAMLQHDEVIAEVPAGPHGEELADEIARQMAFTNGELSIDIPTSRGELTEYWSGH